MKKPVPLGFKRLWPPLWPPLWHPWRTALSPPALPPPLLPLHALAVGLSQGHITAEQVMRQAITRLQHLDPLLHMLLLNRSEAALVEAQAADRRRQAGQALGPLDGLPMTIKDSLDTAGIRTTYGCLHRLEEVPERDATTVARLRRQGLILLGKSNLPELAYGIETDNLLVGRTRNPWKPACSVGGSSGGEAALIASGCSPLGLGTDLCGSLRIPAHFAGVCSLKPGRNALPLDGSVLRFSAHVFELAAIGPLAAQITDLALAFALLTEQQDTLEALLRAPEPFFTKQREGHAPIQVAFFDDPALSSACRQAVRQAAELLQRAGHPVQFLTSPALTRCETLWEDFIYSDGIEGLRRGLADGQPLQPLRELLLQPFGYARRHRLAILPLYLERKRRPIPLEQTRAALQEAEQQLQLDLPPGGLILSPVTPDPARHWLDLRELKERLRYVKPANVLGLAAVTLPVERGAPGKLPVAVQLMGRPGEEWRVLAVARTLEQQLNM